MVFSTEYREGQFKLVVETDIIIFNSIVMGTKDLCISTDIVSHPIIPNVVILSNSVGQIAMLELALPRGPFLT